MHVPNATATRLPYATGNATSTIHVAPQLMPIVTAAASPRFRPAALIDAAARQRERDAEPNGSATAAAAAERGRHFCAWSCRAAARRDVRDATNFQFTRHQSRASLVDWHCSDISATVRVELCHGAARTSPRRRVHPATPRA